jgi:hypothetical protein
MDLDTPLDLSRDARHLDESGTPSALIELARQRNDLAVVDALAPEDVVTEWLLGTIWSQQTGCVRFARLRAPTADGKRYALVRGSA